MRALIAIAILASSAAACAPPDAQCTQWGGFCAPLSSQCPPGSTAIPGVPCNAQLGGFDCLCCSNGGVQDELAAPSPYEITEADCPCELVDCMNTTCVSFYQTNCTELCGDSIDNNCDSVVDEVDCVNITDSPTPAPTADSSSSSEDSDSDSDSDSDETSSDSDDEPARRRRRRHRDADGWFWGMFGGDGGNLSLAGVFFVLLLPLCICCAIIVVVYTVRSGNSPAGSVDDVIRDAFNPLADKAEYDPAPIPLRNKRAVADVPLTDTMRIMYEGDDGHED